MANCVNHPDSPAVATCKACETSVCILCVVDSHGVSFCSEACASAYKEVRDWLEQPARDDEWNPLADVPAVKAPPVPAAAPKSFEPAKAAPRPPAPVRSAAAPPPTKAPPPRPAPVPLATPPPAPKPVSSASWDPVAADAAPPPRSKMPLFVGIAAVVAVVAGFVVVNLLPDNSPLPPPLPPPDIAKVEPPKPPPLIPPKPELPKPEVAKPELPKPEPPKPVVPKPEPPKPEPPKPEVAKPEPPKPVVPKPEPPKPEVAKPEPPKPEPPKPVVPKPEPPKPEVAKPEPPKPKPPKPEPPKPEVVKPEPPKPEPPKPVVPKPEPPKPEVAKPEPPKPEPPKPEVAKPEPPKPEPPKPVPPKAEPLPYLGILRDPWEKETPGAWYRIRYTLGGRDSFKDVGLKETGSGYRVVVSQSYSQGVIDSEQYLWTEPETLVIQGATALEIQGVRHDCDVVQIPSLRATKHVLKSGPHAGVVVPAEAPVLRLDFQTIKVKERPFECTFIETEQKDTRKRTQIWFCPSFPQGTVRMETEGVSTALVDWGPEWSKRPPFPETKAEVARIEPPKPVPPPPKPVDPALVKPPPPKPEPVKEDGKVRAQRLIAGAAAIIRETTPLYREFADSVNPLPKEAPLLQNLLAKADRVIAALNDARLIYGEAKADASDPTVLEKRIRQIDELINSVQGSTEEIRRRLK